MAAVTQSAVNRYGTMGDRHIVFATFTSVADTNTWDTGLKIVDGYNFNIEEAADAGDALTVTSVSGPTITFGVAGTIGVARGFAIGCG